MARNALRYDSDKLSLHAAKAKILAFVALSER